MRLPIINEEEKAKQENCRKTWPKCKGVGLEYEKLTGKCEICI